MRKLIAAVAAVPLLGLMFLAGIPAAQAQPAELCGNGGSGYCMNAWNGGPYVKMYYGGYSNDYFFTTPVYACSGHDTVQSNCPFSNTAIDSRYAGALMVEVVYGNNSVDCVGTAASDVGYLGSCGNIYGSGAINGAIDVVEGNDMNPNCNFLINRYWTNHDNEEAYLVSGGNPGTSLYVGSTSSSTCWGR